MTYTADDDSAASITLLSELLLWAEVPGEKFAAPALGEDYAIIVNFVRTILATRKRSEGVFCLGSALFELGSTSL